jgi:hypothetical protein
MTQETSIRKTLPIAALESAIWLDWASTALTNRPILPNIIIARLMPAFPLVELFIKIAYQLVIFCAMNQSAALENLLNLHFT